MKTNFYPNRQFYTNDAEQDYWSGVRLKEKENKTVKASDFKNVYITIKTD